MPSAPGYVRNYAEEQKTAKQRGEARDNAIRHKARRLATKRGMVRPKDGKDLDHRVPLSKGGAPVDPKNFRIESEHDNRSYPRNPDGSMIRNSPKTK